MIGSGAGHTCTRAGVGRWNDRGPVRWCLPRRFGPIRVTRARIRAIKSLTSACFHQVGHAPGRLDRVAGVCCLSAVSPGAGSRSGRGGSPPSRVRSPFRSRGMPCRTRRAWPVSGSSRNAARPGVANGRFFGHVHGTPCTAAALKRRRHPRSTLPGDWRYPFAIARRAPLTTTNHCTLMHIRATHALMYMSSEIRVPDSCT